MATLGQDIRARRLDLGLTQGQLAQRIGDGELQSDVSRLEHDDIRLPRRPKLERIAAALELPVGVLLARAGWAGAEATFGPAQQPGGADNVAAEHDALVAEAKAVLARLDGLLKTGAPGTQAPTADGPPDRTPETVWQHRR